jgi:hypothetical protein
MTGISHRDTELTDVKDMIVLPHNGTLKILGVRNCKILAAKKPPNEDINSLQLPRRSLAASVSSVPLWQNKHAEFELIISQKSPKPYT